MSESWLNPAGHTETRFVDRVEVTCHWCGNVTVYDGPPTSYDDNPTHLCATTGDE